ncbi:AIR carboxylase family protein [Parasphaerochaeta coccoides]|uniref:Phosphoribosylaminoimidazole carboxylase n=1 Tax=Parasphaerochaeta coccoides (strain ATCC BAA-1237 / DSM 17374 / SPN1) TaxID=760011 RepID=F4GHX2_PARC1|nr:AIR carboxylase family protein [Parasphaerochaeta coccoides]AEC02085.1 1-(5-phosphoribosyl)-5-amino-4-imidazole- carboxylate (AIR) carboxylase [Parasphaerochaeta coccoides DSM 17374]
MAEIVIIMGSESDRPHAEKISTALKAEGYAKPVGIHVASAHKQPRDVLKVLEKNAGRKVVYITIAGRSNALSGFVAGNCDAPVIACPPFSDKLDMLVNINSTLQMPSRVPVLTVLDPANAALGAMRIIALDDLDEQKKRDRQDGQVKQKSCEETSCAE